jgi:hypothetical protein
MSRLPKIKINGDDADIKIEDEKTVGEIFAGLGLWLDGTGHRLSGMALDGQAVGESLIAASFERKLDSVKVIDIFTSPITDLFAESLKYALLTLDVYEKSSFAERPAVLAMWKNTPASVMLAEQNKNLHQWIEKKHLWVKVLALGF